MVAKDLTAVAEIDGTILSTRYMHVDQTGEGLSRAWALEDRPLRERLVRSNPLDDERQFMLKQIVSGIEEGGALVADYDGEILALLMMRRESPAKIMRITELRVDSDYRRQGIASALVFQCVRETREQNFRAVAAETTTDNAPANDFLAKCGFELAGIDTHRWTNHDLVKECVTLYWYAPLD